MGEFRISDLRLWIEEQIEMLQSEISNPQSEIILLLTINVY